MTIWQTFRGLLADRRGWIATGLFGLGSAAVYFLIEGPAASLGYYEYQAISRTAGLILSAFYIFPLTRILMRGRIPMDEPRIYMWIALAVTVNVLSFALSSLLTILIYILAPDALLLMPPEWHQPVIETFVLVPLLGLFVWETGLIAGRLRPGLGSSMHYVWKRRPRFLLIYLAIILIDLVLALAVWRYAAEGAALPALILYFVQFALFGWLLNLFLIALYLDLARDPEPDAHVFE